ncbi:hypothetical protein ABIC01_009236, partial [Bradyrhizobium sp. RT4b]
GPTPRFPAKSNTTSRQILLISQINPHSSRTTVYEGRSAIRITGSPFKTFDEAEAACDAMLKLLMSEN